MPAPPPIAELVERFGQQSDAYKSGRYNETQLRREFVDPMFKALGWDMDDVSSVRTMESKSAAVNRARQFALIIVASTCAIKAPMAKRDSGAARL